MAWSWVIDYIIVFFAVVSRKHGMGSIVLSFLWKILNYNKTTSVGAGMFSAGNIYLFYLPKEYDLPPGKSESSFR